MQGLQQIDIKVFVKKGEDIPPYDFMPVLQRWIQKHTIPGALIDVADYSHIHNGPGIILVAHEHNVSVDYNEGRMGLLFHQKQPLDGSLQERMKLCLKYAFMACVELQREPEFDGRLEFDSTKVLFLANDRLHAPNDDVTGGQVEEQLSEVAGRIFDGELDLHRRSDDPRDRIVIEVHAQQPQEFLGLIENCSEVITG